MDLEVSKTIVEKTEEARADLKKQLASDFRDWMAEDTKRESSRHQDTTRIQQAIKHVNDRVEAELRAEQEANEEMFDEITTQLHNNDR